MRPSLRISQSARCFLSKSYLTKVNKMARDSDDYTIEQRGNCVLVFGALPMSDFSKMLKKVPKKVRHVHPSCPVGGSKPGGRNA
jgi:hypothetical protein